MSIENKRYSFKLSCYDCPLIVDGIRPCGDGFNLIDNIKDDISSSEYPCKVNIVTAISILASMANYKNFRYTTQAEEDWVTIFSAKDNIIKPNKNTVFAEVKNGTISLAEILSF